MPLLSSPASARPSAKAADPQAELSASLLSQTRGFQKHKTIPLFSLFLEKSFQKSVLLMTTHVTDLVSFLSELMCTLMSPVLTSKMATSVDAGPKGKCAVSPRRVLGARGWAAAVWPLPLPEFLPCRCPGEDAPARAGSGAGGQQRSLGGRRRSAARPPRREPCWPLGSGRPSDLTTFCTKRVLLRQVVFQGTQECAEGRGSPSRVSGSGRGRRLPASPLRS